MGRVLAGVTSDTRSTDSDLRNGNEYHNSVGASFGGRRCGSPMTTCTSITPGPRSDPDLGAPGSAADAPPAR